MVEVIRMNNEVMNWREDEIKWEHCTKCFLYNPENSRGETITKWCKGREPLRLSDNPKCKHDIKTFIKLMREAKMRDDVMVRHLSQFQNKSISESEKLINE